MLSHRRLLLLALALLCLIALTIGIIDTLRCHGPCPGTAMAIAHILWPRDFPASGAPSLIPCVPHTRTPRAPSTDEEALACLVSNDPLLQSTMQGLYRTYRAMGDDIPIALIKTCRDLVDPKTHPPLPKE